MDFVDLCRAVSNLSFLVVFEGRRDLDINFVAIGSQKFVPLE